MQATYKTRTTLEQRLEYVKECRRSGLSDAEWCRQNDIPVSTFYTWVSRLRKQAADIPQATYGHSETPAPRQDVVPVDIVPGTAERDRSAAMPQIHSDLDNSHTIMIELNGARIFLNNEADPVLITRTLRILGGVSC